MNTTMLFILMLNFIGCGQASNTTAKGPTIQHVDDKQFQSKMTEKNTVVLDVRTKDEVSEGYIKEYMRAQEVKFAEEIFRAREALQREIANIEAMREDISKPYWRAMAGVFVTTEFEASIESVIKQCQTIQTKNIEFETTGYKLKDMEKYLVDSVKQRLERIH